MDRDTHDLVVLLCTRAGMVMEDASADALAVGSFSQLDMGGQIDRLLQATETATSLLEAARRLTKQ